MKFERFVAPGPDRQHVSAAGASEAAKDAPVDVEGASATSAPVHAAQPPPAARTISQRLARLKEDVHRIQVSLGEWCEVMDAMAEDFYRFTVWAAGGLDAGPAMPAPL
ncbi:hypothetical protein Tco_0974112 [Tanacetum coccineum]|uniref:Uncharacterized protein n=1 Tax=Tanacetum coccineum TaxID=301880 RepID=A0ABQ5EAN1_9ASTR